MLEFLGYLIVGGVAGTLAGLLGIGGGMVVVPALLTIFHFAGFAPDIAMHMAVGTSLATMLVASLASMRAHSRRGIIIWPVYKRLALGIILGVAAGAILAGHLRSTILTSIFGLSATVVAMTMFRNVQPSPHRQLPGIGSFFISLLIGIYSGLLGVGGGIITVPFLIYCNVPVRQVIGVSAAVSITVAVVGTMVYILTGMYSGVGASLPAWSTGYVYWPAVAGVAIVSPFFANLGAVLSHRLPTLIVRRLFAVFLLLVGIRMLF